MNEQNPSFKKSEQQKFQAGYYNNSASDFDTKHNRENANHLYKIEQIAETFFRHLNQEQECFDFMEVGSGTGIHAYHFLKDHSAKINSIMLSDISENMLHQAQKRLHEFTHKTSYAVMPAEKFATGKTFDGIFVSGSMHHFSSPKAALAEMKKHLNPGGVVVICEPVVWNPVNFFKALREIRSEYGQFKVQRGNVRRYLQTLGYQILTERVLHYRAGSPALRRLIPYKRLEDYSFFNAMAVMFLFGARLEP